MWAIVFAGLVIVVPIATGDEAGVNRPAVVATDAAVGLIPIAAVETDGEEPRDGESTTAPTSPTWDPASLLGERGLAAIVPSALLLGVMTLAPAVLLMTTCFVRMSVVLMLVRQGIGAAGIPSNQIVASLAIFLSAMVMWPVWTRAWNEGVAPYQAGELSTAQAFERGSLPIRRWMATQIEAAGNRETVLLFLERVPGGPRVVTTYDDVPPEALLPAFLVSELETAFTIGLRLLLPFLVLDILVATLVVATGLVMLPPSLVSLPLKLLVFVTADGWTLVVRALLDGFVPG
jgi:flagellar biosynthetic protein FliP